MQKDAKTQSILLRQLLPALCAKTIIESLQMNTEIEIKKSPLCQTVESNEKTVQVEIYSDGNGKWLLEVVDEYNNSTVWEDLFPSDQAALDELNDTIKTEGIDCLIDQVQ
ncbi:MAG: hypothetical protein ACI9Y1_003041 [Lentisphaeria bacterium]